MAAAYRAAYLGRGGRGGAVLLCCLTLALAWRAAAVPSPTSLNGTIDYTSEWAAGAGVYTFSDPTDNVVAYGYEITSVIFYPDTGNHTLYIAIDTDRIAGDADGNGLPGLWGDLPQRLG